MQGQSPAVSTSAPTGTTSPDQNAYTVSGHLSRFNNMIAKFAAVNHQLMLDTEALANSIRPTQKAIKKWTCQRWFNSIATTVSAKTHRYVGKFVAVVTLPVIFIPSLANDLFCGIKNLCQRRVSKAPVVNQVSTKGTASSTPPATQSDNTVVLPPIVLPDSVRAYSRHTPPTIEQLREDFPELNQVISAMEASAQEVEQQLAEHTMTIRKLEVKLDQRQCVVGNMVMKCDRQQKNLTSLQRQLEESMDKNNHYEDNISDLNKHIERVTADYKKLELEHHKLTGQVRNFFPSRHSVAKLDCVVEEPSEKDEPLAVSCADEPHSSDQIKVIVLEPETPAVSSDDPESVDINALNDAIVEPEDLSEPASDAQESRESTLADDSDDSFETIYKPEVAVATATDIPEIIVSDFNQPDEVKADAE